MAKKVGYETGIAAEFYVLSCLHRLGLSATLTLGNKKSVDIVISHAEGRAITVDVKGVAGKHDWPADNIPVAPARSHFLVLISFEGRFVDVQSAPSVWVLPHDEVGKFVKQYSGRRNISRALLMKNDSDYLDAWHLLTVSMPRESQRKPARRFTHPPPGPDSGASPMKQRSNEEIARAARDGAGIDAAVKRAVAKELEMRRNLGLPIVTEESMRSSGVPGPKCVNGNGQHPAH
jgi:hypothetical protein